MRFVIQCVSSAKVDVEGKTVGEIGKGFLVLAGISDTDDEKTADAMVRKMLGLRVFEDSEGKTNLNLETVGGNLLIISQFTLYADCRKGNRPSFIKAGSPEHAEKLYQYILKKVRDQFPDTQEGVFGAYMNVSLVNEGPFTVILDSDELLKKKG
ncbi:MAG: D-aminoacyl-tRNA deacylase [Lachnospiraceae bacterium]|nr:D-aminoacyl-tRNA deacylase [Lachnospiraceae bacterium]